MRSEFKKDCKIVRLIDIWKVIGSPGFKEFIEKMFFGFYKIKLMLTLTWPQHRHENLQKIRVQLCVIYIFYVAVTFVGIQRGVIIQLLFELDWTF